MDLPCTTPTAVKFLITASKLDKDSDVPGIPNEIPNFQLYQYFLLQDLLKLPHQLLLHPLPIQSLSHFQHSSLSLRQHFEPHRIRSR